MNKFKISDSVVLKIGSHVMAINDIKEDICECIWQDDTGKPHNISYHYNLLELADDSVSQAYTG